MGKQKDSRKLKMTEEEKKQKFGDAYNPHYSASRREKSYKPVIENKANDWEWYALSEEIAQQTGNFSYSDLTGVTTNMKNKVTGTEYAQFWAAENVMRIGYCNAQLANAESTASLSKAATQLYVFLRHVNSGAKNYEPADLMAVILAMREVYAEFFEIKRAIGVAKYFNYFNRSIPEVLQNAMRIDFEDLKDNIAQYTGKLNILANTINSVAIPKYFKAFDRAALISSIVFADSDSMRGQFYLYDRDAYFTYSSTKSEQGTSLVYALKSAGALETLATRLDRLDTMVGAILDDTDANTITGDILHAFKDSEVYVLSQVQSDYMVVPMFNEDLLAQVENGICTTLYGMYFPNPAGSGYNGSWDVTQNNGRLYWQPSVEVASAQGRLNLSNYLFNSHKDEPTYKDNLEWSRLISVVEEGDAENNKVQLTVTGCGLELVQQFTIFQIVAGVVQSLDITQAITSVTPSDSAFTSVLKLMSFDWHPAIYRASRTQDVVTNSYQLLVGMDVKKYVWLTAATVKKIHDAANNASFTSLDLYALRR